MKKWNKHENTVRFFAEQLTGRHKLDVSGCRCLARRNRSHAKCIRLKSFFLRSILHIVDDRSTIISWPTDACILCASTHQHRKKNELCTRTLADTKPTLNINTHLLHHHHAHGVDCTSSILESKLSSSSNKGEIESERSAHRMSGILRKKTKMIASAQLRANSDFSYFQRMRRRTATSCTN